MSPTEKSAALQAARRAAERAARCAEEAAAAAQEAAAATLDAPEEPAAERDRDALATALGRLSEGVMVVDEEHVITAANPRAVEIVGRPLVGLPVERAKAGLCRADGSPMPLAERPSSRALAGEVVAPIDLAVRRPDGALYPVAVSAAPLRGGGEHARGAVVVFEETTRLAEALRRRAEWIAMIAHDLRQPLMVIELALRLLARKRPPTTPEEERLLQRTQSATESINRLVGDLLDVARIESGQLRVVRRPTDVGALAREVADRVGGVEHAAIEVETRGRTGEVAVDPERVAQLLGNLLSNAVKYGDPGAPVRVGVEVSDDATELWVENTGEPIPEAERAEIFTRFYRASNAGTRRGTGLGLTICKAIAEAHGGGVHVESPGPRTTRFRARLGPA